MKTTIVRGVSPAGTDPRSGNACATLGARSRRVAAQDAATAGPETHPGVKVGEKAPRFTLKDQAGKDRSLDEFLAKGKVALVFYRSADW